MLTRRDVRGRKSHFVVDLINICDLRVSVDRSVDKCVLLSVVLLMCPSIHSVRPLIYQSIGIPSVNFSIDRRLRVFIDRPIGKCVLMSDFLLMCTSVHFVRLLTNRSIDQSIDQ